MPTVDAQLGSKCASAFTLTVQNFCFFQVFYYFQLILRKGVLFLLAWVAGVARLRWRCASVGGVDDVLACGVQVEVGSMFAWLACYYFCCCYY